MKSSEKAGKPKRSKGGFLANGPIYSLLAMYMPLAIVTAMAFLLRTLLPIPVPLGLLLIFGGLGALTASIYCDFMKDNKANRSAANVRGGILIMLLFYALSSLFKTELSVGRRFIPHLTNILVFIETLYVWGSVISLKHIFSARRCFEGYTQKYEGAELQKAILEDSSLMQYTDENITSIRKNYQVQLFFVCIVTFIGVFMKTPMPLALYIILLVTLACGICISGFFGIMRLEHYYAGEGMTLSVADRFKRMLGIAIFTLCSIVVAIILSSNKSILPFSIIKRFLKWIWKLLIRFLPENERPEIDDIEPIAEMEQFVAPIEEVLQQERRAPWPIWKWLQYAFFALLGILFIWFIISPLLNRGERTERLTFLQRLRRIFEEWYKGIKFFLASIAGFFRFGKSVKKIRRPDDDEIRRTAESIFGAYSPAKKRDMRRSVTLFARLIIWGSEVRHVSWKPSLAPGEYCGILAAAVPVDDTGEDAAYNKHALERQNEGIIRCGELFEQALYSAEVLSDAERNEFKDIVEEITAVSDS